MARFAIMVTLLRWEGCLGIIGGGLSMGVCFSHWVRFYHGSGAPSHPHGCEAGLAEGVLHDLCGI